jgi:hypothetical protein
LLSLSAFLILHGLLPYRHFNFVLCLQLQCFLPCGSPCFSLSVLFIVVFLLQFSC